MLLPHLLKTSLRYDWFLWYCCDVNQLNGLFRYCKYVQPLLMGWPVYELTKTVLTEKKSLTILLHRSCKIIRKFIWFSFKLHYSNFQLFKLSTNRSICDQKQLHVRGFFVDDFHKQSVDLPRFVWYSNRYLLG